ncbi:MAG: ABC transporter substrate-binding protein, partial [Oscillospiraceae bacterium]
PGSLDPQFADSSVSSLVITNLFEGLVRLSDGGKIEPACAERYEISEDQRVYTFYLREGLLWQDGSALTAGDFVFAFWRLFDPGAPSAAAASYGSIQNAPEILAGKMPLSSLGVTAPNDRTVVIRLSTPDLSMPALLSEPAAMPCPEQFFRAQKGRYGLNVEAVMGNGPFTLQSWDTQLIELARSERYRQPPQIGGVNLYLGRGDPVELFLAGRSDLCLIPYQRLSEADGLVSGTLVLDQSWVLMFHLDKETGRQKALRRALIGALEYPVPARLLPEGVAVSGGLVSPAAVLRGENYREMVGNVQPPPAEADPRTLFLSALGELGLDKLPRTTLLVSNFSPGPELGGAMQSIWREKLSVHINMEQLSYSELLRRVESGRFDLALLPIPASGNGPGDALARFAEVSLSDPPAPDADQASESGQTFGSAMAAPDPSPASASSETVGAMLEQARRCADSAEAAALYLAAEQQVIDDYAAMPMFDAPSLFAVGKGLSGVERTASAGSIYFGGAALSDLQ